MIRNATLVKLRAGTPPAVVDEICSALRAMAVPGMRSLTCGADLGLREGNATVGVVADLDDEAAYRAYDADAEHNRIRRELIAPHAEAVHRVQFSLEG